VKSSFHERWAFVSKLLRSGLSREGVASRGRLRTLVYAPFDGARAGRLPSDSRGGFGSDFRSVKTRRVPSCETKASGSPDSPFGPNGPPRQACSNNQWILLKLGGRTIFASEAKPRGTTFESIPIISPSGRLDREQQFEIGRCPDRGTSEGRVWECYNRYTLYEAPDSPGVPDCLQAGPINPCEKGLRSCVLPDVLPRVQRAARLVSG